MFTLPAGDVSIELLTFYNQTFNSNGELTLLVYTPPGGDPQAIPPSLLTPELSLFETTTAADGTFRIPNVPTGFGNIAASVSLSGSTLGRSSSVSPVGGAVTNVGTIVVSPPAAADVALPLFKVAIPGFANSVAVQDNFAFVAAGAEGLQVIDISNRVNPQIVTAVPLAGNANDVKILFGQIALIAGGAAGLHIVDVFDPTSAYLAETVPVPGQAWDIAASEYESGIFVAAGTAGLVIVDNFSFPMRVVSVTPLPGIAKGVELYEFRDLSNTLHRYAIVALGVNGIAVLDASTAGSPILLSILPGGDVRDVVLSPQLNYVFIADAVRGVAALDLAVPTSPVLRLGSGIDGSYESVAIFSYTTAAAAGRPFENKLMTPIYNTIPPTTFPLPRRTIDFGSVFGDTQNERGTGVALDSNYVYFTTAAGGGSVENGVRGTTFLYIGQYLR
jgi:large repetitive protein